MMIIQLVRCFSWKDRVRVRRMAQNSSNISLQYVATGNHSIAVKTCQSLFRPFQRGRLHKRDRFLTRLFQKSCFVRRIYPSGKDISIFHPYSKKPFVERGMAFPYAYQLSPNCSMFHISKIYYINMTINSLCYVLHKLSFRK